MKISQHKSEDAIVFSSLFTNYETYLKNDNPKKRHGFWGINRKRENKLKYAYVYLTDSGGMIVRKYKILGFKEDSVIKNKLHFHFNKGKDFFVQYPYGIVRKHHYVFSSQLESLPKLNSLEINIRLDKSRRKKMDKTRRDKITRINAREKLPLGYHANFLYQKQKIRSSNIEMLKKLEKKSRGSKVVLTKNSKKRKNKKILLNKNLKKDWQNKLFVL